ncbi:MAG TPA: 4-(cytidine 5'-diphospho)-2-C-methyl-D-erythritol kinase [Candidatus Norongarragalinales archaeon]|jgi:4-diphosphocytidyl-2-C-methyl-D-erythritol kinase|nr:4-(cytidine 5'-diphospho)-2-C-methyl-D-erythritol kinase [Candidatus Norongarragalinales archaeon]
MSTLKGCAKINLSLDILGTRSDGFHEVSTIMQPLELCDEITIQPHQNINVSFSDARIPNENTVTKTAKAFLAHVKSKKGAHVRVQKNIPLAGGLGGSSADVGPTLVGLNNLARSGYDRVELTRMAGSVGADAAFSVQNKLALSTGKGDKLKLLAPMPQIGIVIIEPKLDYLGKSKTKNAYALFDAHAKRHSQKQTTKQVLDSFKQKDWKHTSKFLGNAFEPVIFHKYPLLAQLAGSLVRNGCYTAHLCGAGPCVYGVCEVSETKKIAQAVSKERGVAAVIPTRTLK